MIARVILCIVLLLPLAIAAQPPGGSLQDLLVQAHSNNAWERYRALQNLASLAEGYPEVQAVLLAGLHDPEALVRRGAAAGLLQAPRLPAALDPLLGALRDPDAEVRAAVAETLGYYGDARALAPLRELLKDKDPKARAGAVGGLGRLPRRDPAARAWGREIPDLLLAATGDPDPAVRAKAAEYLGYLRVARAEEALIRLLDDPSRDVRAGAAHALAFSPSPRAVERLTALLAEPRYNSDSLASEVRFALMRLGEAAQPAVADAAIKSATPQARLHAVEVLSDLPTPRAEEALIAALRDADAGVRAAAARALTGTLNPNAAQVLLPLLADPVEQVRLTALESLARLLPVEQAAALHPALADTNPQVRLASARTLIILGDSGTVEALLALIRHEKPGEAASLLGQLRDVRIAPAIITRWRDEQDTSVREAMVAALGFQGDAEAMPVLTAALEDDETAQAAVDAMTLIGDRSAVPALIAFIARQSGEYNFGRFEAIQALGELQDERAVPVLVKLLRQGEMDAAWALGTIGGTAVPELITLLASKDPNIREEAARGLGVSEDVRAQPALIDIVLQDPSAYVRGMAVRMLGHVANHQAVPAFIAALQKDRELFVRQEAAEVLGWFDDPQAITALIAVAVDTQEPSALRERAISALEYYRDEPSAAALVALLQDADPVVRSAAIRVAGERKITDAAEPLLELLQGQDLRLCGLAATALGQLHEPRAADRLLELLAPKEEPPQDWEPLESNQQVDIRAELALALAGVGDRRAIPLLKSLLAGERYDTGEAFAEALGRLGATDAADQLLPLLRSRNATLRGAIIGLGLLKERRAVPALCLALRDPYYGYEAAEALGRIGDPRAIPSLLTTLDTRLNVNNIHVAVLHACAAFNDPRVIAALKEHLHDRNGEARKAANASLKAIEP